MPVGNRKLLNCAIGRCRVDVLAVRIGHGGAVGNLARTYPGVIPGRRVFPKNCALVSVHRNGLAVGRSHEKHIMLGTLYGGGMEVNSRGIYGPVEIDLAS